MKILLGVCGSISAYKSVDLARKLQNQGHEVKVVLTKGSLQFVKQEVFGYLGITAYGPLDDFQQKGVLHIELARWADTLAIAPLSANTLSKLGQGACDDLLSSVYLSLEPHKVKVLAPAMNTFMLQNSITQNSLEILKNQGAYVIGSDSGILACGDVGEGKLPSTSILGEIIPLFPKTKINKQVLITAGSTLANVDSVRFITNPARGGSAYLLACKFLAEGYLVHVVEGHDVIEEFKYLRKHPRYSFSQVKTTPELLTEVEELLQKDLHYYISPMAVSDLDFEASNTKLKKSALGNSLQFKIAPDVLKHVLDYRTQSKKDFKIVGFAAESSLADDVIQEKITRKPVDLLVANLADSGYTGNVMRGFGTSDGTYRIVTPDLTVFTGHLTKKTLASKIFTLITEGA